MKLELESMYSNNVWTLVDLPQGVKPIGCKWVYKKKRRVDGKVETYKARLVAKCYNKKSCFDYEKTVENHRILFDLSHSFLAH